MRRIGVFSGAFDPIHRGHLRVMEELLTQNKVDEILIVPNALPPYRAPIAPMRHLRAMALEAVADIDHVNVVEEAQLAGCKDTVDVLRKLSRDNPDAQLTYIMGADKLAGLLHWRLANQVFEYCDLIVFPRDGFFGQETTLLAIAHGIRAQLLRVPHMSILSSLVRARIAKFDDALDMILPQTARHIALHGLYQRPYETMVKPQLSPKRYEHTLSVRDLAVELAYKHGLPMQKAAVASLLHDCAKCMKLSQLQAIAKQYNLEKEPGLAPSNALLHGKVGAVLASVKYGVHDEDILDAIRYHTTGRGHMSPLELCVFVADAAEAKRADYPGLKEIRRLMWQDLRQAALVSMLGTADFVKASGQGYSKESSQAIEDLMAGLQWNQENKELKEEKHAG